MLVSHVAHARGSALLALSAWATANSRSIPISASAADPAQVCAPQVLFLRVNLYYECFGRTVLLFLGKRFFLFADAKPFTGLMALADHLIDFPEMFFLLFPMRIIALLLLPELVVQFF